MGTIATDGANVHWSQGASPRTVMGASFGSHRAVAVAAAPPGAVFDGGFGRRRGPRANRYERGANAGSSHPRKDTGTS
jgi:hypothetical protein